jgi:hypothetical protein
MTYQRFEELPVWQKAAEDQKQRAIDCRKELLGQFSPDHPLRKDAERRRII